MFTHLPDAATQARLHDLAKAEAQRLRQEVIRHFGCETVDDFWRGADAVWQRSLETGQAIAERSAARLQARLARRARSRTAIASTPNPSTYSGV
ncbi:MAG: hypothetical protein Q7K57_39730 [Burkholderiaceae bacterium]|nr:hypothetical protein [Burkholderiaceae bacterium]